MYNCIIVTMNSNEIDINEWIVHHILLGFSHIYIFDDNSNPNIKDIIFALPEKYKNCVTIYRLDSHYEINKGDYLQSEVNTKDLLYFDEDIYIKHKTNKQRYLMNFFLKYHKNVSKYCLFCDIDEFIYLKNDNTIDEYLKKMINYDIIYIPWIYYGTSFYVDKPKGLVIDNFRFHTNYYDDGKSIINMQNINEIKCIHTIDKCIDKNKYYSYDRNAKVLSHDIHINHYITKSYKSVLIKKREHCLGQTNDFYRSIKDILMFHAYLNDIRCNNIMEKYVKNVNNVLNYELNTQNEKYINYTPKLYFNDRVLDENYIINNNSIDLIDNIIKSDNVYYK